MFKIKANTMFNNGRTNCAMMRGMEQAEEISGQMERLYLAAWELRKLKGQSNVARHLGMSPQNLRLWERGRPISYEGLVRAQEMIGCDAIWLRNGVGDMVRGGGGTLDDLSDVARLISLYGQADDRGRRLILDFASDQVEIIRQDKGRTSNKV